jgi:hypothetical protein
VTLDTIARNFDSSSLPDVVSGARTERDVYMEFMSLFET